MKKLLLTLFTALLVTLGTVHVIQADDYLRIGMEAAYAPSTGLRMTIPTVL